MEKTEAYTAVVVGGGPAGLFCALRAAGDGRRVLLLEKKPAPGRKLLLAGSGQCNLTQDGDSGAFLSHYGDNGAFLKPALRSFGNRDLVAFFEERGVVMAVEPDGKVFPRSRKASDVLEALVAACAAAKVKVRKGEPVTGIFRSDGIFTIRTSCTTLQAARVVIATGGITYPGTGSTGDGYALAHSLGHRLVEPGPALAAVQIYEYPFDDLAGMSFPGRTVTIARAGKTVRRHTGDLLFTHNGLSGPGIIDFSRFIQAGDTLQVSFLPGLSPEAAEKALLAKIAS
jgi:predicted Rossmann fold flavoprotein